MDRFDSITAFVMVAERNSFAAAARKLGVSASATTRLVAGLEQRLGVRLLNRTTRAISLTDAGQRFLERARRILADLEEAELLAESERGQPFGRIVVSAPHVFGRLHIAPLVCEFMMLNPRVNAELLLGDRQVSLAEEGIDLAVRIGEVSDSADIARNMGAVRRVLVAAPSYLDAHGVPATPADLARHRLIAFTSVASATHWRFGGDDEPVAINPQYVTNSADAAIWHALHGGGIAIVLSYQVADLIKSSALAVVLQGYEPPPLPVKFVYSSSRLLSLKVRAFIDHAAATRNWMFLDI